MYKSTHQFYTSDEWRDVREILLLDRHMTCEVCHKLIHKKYKAIGHHKIELDMSNLNDPTITLNLDNLMLVCNKCHNILHNRFGSKTQHRYLIYGSPLSGKRTYVSESAGKNDLVISMDDIRYGITGGKLYDNSNNTLDDVYAVRDFLIDRVRNKATKAHNIFIVGGYPYKGERERLCKELKLEPIFIDASKEECLARLDMVDDRDKRLWTGYINEWFSRYS